MNRQVLKSRLAARLGYRHSLRRYLMSFLGVLMTITLIAVAVSVSGSVTQIESEAWRGRQREAARNAAQTVATFFQRAEDFLSLVSLFGADELRADPQPLRELLEQYPAFLEVVYVDAGGRVLANTYRDRPVLASLFTISQSQWFQEAVAGGRYHGGVQISAQNAPYLIVAQPAADGGVMAARLSMSVLWDVVAHIRFGEAGRAYIVDRDGQIIAHTHVDLVLNNTSIQGRPELTAALQSPGGEWNGEYVNLEGQPVVGATTAVPELNWVMITELPQAEAYALSRAILISLGGGVLLFSAVLMWTSARVLERMVLRPMERLRAGAARIGQGDLTYRIGLLRRDEIGQVASAFDDMVARLHAREEQVAAQTAALQMSEARYRAIVEDQTELICRWLPDGTLTFVNEAYCRYFGRTREGFIGQTFMPLIPEEDRGLVEAHTASLGRARPMATVEHRVILPDGRLRWQHWTDRAIFDALGNVVEFASVGRDITERKQAEDALRRLNEELEDRVRQRTAELEHSNRELQQFAYVASHDLQEPLRMVTSYLQLLKRRYQGRLDSDADEFIAFAVDGATRMHHLINDLLAYSRVGTRGQPFEPADCQAIFDQVVTNLKIAIEESGATVTCDPLPKVTADGSQLAQLLQNLIGNAIKFRDHRPPQVHVSAERRNGSWQFAVRDNGIGLEPQYAERIFLIFQRLHTRAEYPGTGIGLAICKKIVERHDGRIWVESQPGHGATFYFTLPDKAGLSP
jgi:PAS domain S-box-containing protein